MKILGLTGDIAAGKSTVGRMLQKRGAAYLDADLEVRQLYAQPTFAARIAGRFGDVLDASGFVDRRKLGPLVFSNAAKLAELEALVHPAVAALRREQLQTLRLSGTQFVVIEAVKLLEGGQSDDCDEIWCIVAWHSVQVARLMNDRRMARDDAERRLEAQPSPEAKRALAGRVPLLFLSNNGTLAQLEARVEAEWTRFSGG
jgi:dephospho-CoA kinase